MSNPATASLQLRQHRAFVQFWCARVASGFGFQMLSVAVGWQIYAITGRAFDLGLIGLVQFIPSVLLALPAGHVADQFERRRVVLAGLVVEWTAIVLLAVLTLLGRIHETGILLLVFAIGVAKAFESGMLAAWLGAVGSAVVGGLGTLVVVGLWMAMFPGLRRRQRLQLEEPANETLGSAESV